MSEISAGEGWIQDADRLASLVAEASHAVAFTGAGLSTECGIPDFRSPGGLWSRNKPIPFQAFVASEEARREAWRRKFAMDDSYRGAEPGSGHRALVALQQRGRLHGVITQNIDNLHQASGLPDDRLIEIHGNGTYASCLACGRRHELPQVRARFEAAGVAPDCEDCGGLVKSATISFGQAMPERQMRLAVDWARRCDLFIAIGTSLVVYPAAGLPIEAKRAGAAFVIVNGEETALDGEADLVVRGDIGAVLSRVAQRLSVGETLS